MKEENYLVHQLSKLGLTQKQSIELLSAPIDSSTQEGWADTFNTKSDLVVWLNDLENDAMYKQFQPSVYSLLQPSSPNQFRFLQKNLFSVVIFADFRNSAQLKEVAAVFSVLYQKAPLRFAIIPFLRADSSRVSRLLALGIHEILKLDTNNLNYFVKLLQKGVSDSPADMTEVVVAKAFLGTTGRTLDLSLKTTDDILEMFVGYNERLGVTEKGAVFGNGVFASFEAVCSISDV